MTISIEANNDITYALEGMRWQRQERLLYRDYFQGLHRFGFATAVYARAFRELLRGLRLNLCPSVVNALTDRLKVTGFHGNGPGMDQAGADAWQIWQDMRLARHMNQIHIEAVTSGDAFLIVWPDPDGQPCFHPQQAMDCFIRYDGENTNLIQLGAKLWADPSTGRYRLNLYYADRIEKYQSTTAALGANQASMDSPTLQLFFAQVSIPPSSASFEPFQAEGEPWPVPNPYGVVPMFHFAYDAGIGQFGVSELRDVVPLQDAINKELADLIVASEFGAFRQRYAIGIEPAGYDEDGDPIQQELKTGVDRLLTVANSEAKFGEFSETPLANFINTIDSLRSNIAAIKGIPLTQLMMSGAFPSGESQKTAEARLVAKVENTQLDFGDVWEDAMEFALQITGTQNASIRADWMDPATRSEFQLAQALSLQTTTMGLPYTEAWRQLGYSDDDIERLKAEYGEQQAAANVAFQGAFNKG